MPVSQRDQRVRVYAQSSAGSGGFEDNAYAYVGEYWMSASAPTGSSAIIASQQETRQQGLFGCDAHVPVTLNGLVRWLGAGENLVYQIRAILPQQSRGEKQIIAVYVDDATYAISEDPPLIDSTSGHAYSDGTFH